MFITVVPGVGSRWNSLGFVLEGGKLNNLAGIWGLARRVALVEVEGFSQRGRVI